MVHKKYIKRNGILYGPYYYESYRENGRVKKRYIKASDIGEELLPSSNLSERKPIGIFRKEFLIFIFIAIAVLLIGSVFYIVSNKNVTLTGFAGADIKVVYEKGDNLAGTISFNLHEGELIPANSKVIIQFGNYSLDHALSELVDEQIVSGTYYADGYKLKGGGEGYGIAGKSNPTVDFEFEILKTDSTQSENSESGSDADTNENVGIVEQQPISEQQPVEQQPVEQPAIEQPTGTEQSTTEQQPISEQQIGEVSTITGMVLSEGSSDSIIQGSVRAGEDYSYALNSGETARIVPGSVKINGETVGDDKINLQVLDGKAIVKTDYSEERKGYGNDYLGKENLILKIDISKLKISAEHSGELFLKLVFDNIVIASSKAEIVVNGENENESSSNFTLIDDEEKTNLTMLKEIPVLRIAKDGHYILNLSEYFANAEGYSVDISNINVEFNGDLVTFRPKEGIKGVMNGKITAYSGEDKLDSNPISVLVSSGAIKVETSRDKIKINEKVKWKKNITLETPEKIDIELPAEAENVSIKKIENGTEIAAEGSITGNAILEYKSNNGLMTKFMNLFRRQGLTGRVISENSAENASISVSLADNATNYVVEYYTEAPKSTERETPLGKEVIVSAPDELGYTDVLSFTTLQEVFEIGDENKIEIYWAENDSYIPFDAYDMDGDGKLDYIEWITPHLSEQTFEIILMIKAAHLDKNKNFVSDIYDSVKEYDGVWSEPVSSGEYVRARFERNLTDKNDITLYAKSNRKGTNVVVYPAGSNVSLAVFPEIYKKDYYKIYLNGTKVNNDLFDLKIVGSYSNSYLILDHIIDPKLSARNGTFFEDFESGTLLMNNWTDAGTGKPWVVVSKSTNSVYEGKYGLKAEDTDGESAIELNLDTTSYNQMLFSFYARTFGLDDGEYLAADWYNGTGWSNMMKVQDLNGYKPLTFNLTKFVLSSAANNNPKLRIRFRCNSDSPSEGCLLDNVGFGTGFIIYNLPNNMQAFLVENNSIDVTTTPQTGKRNIYIAKGNKKNIISKLTLDFSTSLDFSDINMTINKTLKKSVMHKSSYQDSISSRELLIPNSGAGAVYVCPKAETLDEVSSNCPQKVLIRLGETVSGMTLTETIIEGENYYLVSNVSGTGGSEVDLTAPAVSILYPLSINYSQNITQINYTVSDNVALGRCWYSTNNGITNITIGCGTNVTGLSTSEGSNTWKIWANDSSGNNNVSSATFSVSLNAPTVNIISPIEGVYNTRIVLVNITNSSATNLWFTNSSGQNESYTTPVYRIWNEGANTIKAYANNSAGRVNSTTLSFSIDTLAPAITIYSPLNAEYNYSNILVNFSSDSYQSLWYNNGSANISYSSPSNVNLGDGFYEFIFYANDSVGNLNYGTVSFSVNTSLPQSEIPSEPISVLSRGNSVNTNYNYLNLIIDSSETKENKKESNAAADEVEGKQEVNNTNSQENEVERAEDESKGNEGADNSNYGKKPIGIIISILPIILSFALVFMFLTYFRTTKKKKNIKKSSIYVILIAGALLSLAFFAYRGGMFSNSSDSINAQVSLEMLTSYSAGEQLSGNLRFGIKEGELIPANSIVIAQLGGQRIERILSELVSVENRGGSFYAENTNINGIGRGYGVEGTKIVYPNINFELEIAAIEAGTEQPTTEQQPVEQPTEEPQTGTEQPQSPEGVGVTGMIIGENNQILNGEVSKEKDYSYALNSGETARIVSGSVKINGETVGDDKINLQVLDGKAIVKTDYSEERKGYGNDYLGKTALELNIDISKFNISAESGKFEIELSYNAQQLVSAEEDIAVNAENNTAELEQPKNKTLEEIPLNETIIANFTQAVIKTSHERIKLGERVRWVKNITLETPEKMDIELPAEAEDISVLKIEDNKKIKIDKIKITGSVISGRVISGEVVSGQVSADIQLERESAIKRFFKKIFKFLFGSTIGITGNIIGEAAENPNIILSLEDNTTNYVVEYYTEAPSAREEITSQGKKVVISASSELNYTDVLSYTNIPEIQEVGEENKIQIYWVENNSYVPFDAYDLDSNGKLDYVEWITPHLSNQTFNIILITAAQHLDSNRTLIEDIYNETGTLDDVWKEIPAGHYARVTFERNLTSSEDITIYARSNYSNASVQVYEKNGNQSIADFGTISSNGQYKVYLINLTQERADFDLRISGNPVDFDYIVDPVAQPNGTIELRAQGCGAESNAGAANTFTTLCQGTYPAACGSGAGNDRLSCRDGFNETISFSGNGKWSGINITSFNSSVTNCLSISQVYVCNEWWATSTSIGSCAIAVDANGGASYNTASSVCPGTTANPGVICYNVTANESWTCGNFFGASGTRAVAKNELQHTAGGTFSTITDVLYFNVTYVVDEVPVVNLRAPVNGTNTTSSIVFFSANFTDDLNLRNATLFVYNSTGGVFGTNFTNITGITNSTNLSLTISSDGTYFWNYLVADNASHVVYNNSNFTLYRDASGPLVQFASPSEVSGANLTRNNILINVTATDAVSGVKNISIYLFNSTGNLINRTNSLTSPNFVNYTQLADGIYFFNATAYDNAGNFNRTETRNVTIDSANPGIQFVNPTETSGSLLTRNNIAVNATATDTNLKNISIYLFNSTGNLINRTNSLTSPNFVNYTQLADGIYFFNATAYDNAGNFNRTETRNVTIDSANPGIQFVSPTENSSSILVRDNILINATATDTNLANLTIYLYNSTGNLINRTNSLTSPNFVNYTNLADGIYFFNATAYDNAGNFNRTETRNVTIDSANPGIQFVNPTEVSGSLLTRNKIAVNATATDTNLKNISIYLFNSTGNLINRTNSLTSPNFVNYTQLADGIYFFNATAYDNAGNFNRTETRNVTIDTISPTITISNPSNSTYNFPLISLITTIDSSAQSCYYSLNGGSNITFNCSSIVNITAVEGSNNIIVYANDSAGNLNSATRFFVLDTSINLAVNIISPANGTVTNDATPNIQVLAIDKVSNSISNRLFVYYQNGTLYNSTGNIDNLINNTAKTITIFPPLALIGNATTYRIFASANDSLGYTSNSSDVYITLATPTVSLISPQNGAYIFGLNIDFRFKYSSAISPSANCSLYINGVLNQSNGTTLDNVETSFLVSNLSEGSGQNWTIVCNVSGIMVNDSSVINVDNTSPFVYVAYPANSSYNSVQTALNYTAMDNFALDKCWYSINNGQTNVSVLCGQNVSGLNSSQGSNSWRVYANDSAGNLNSSSVTFYVDSLNPSIQFVSPTENSSSILVRDNILINATATDTNLANLTIYLYNSTGNLINRTNSLTSPNFVNYTNLAEGIYFFNATAYDNVGNFNRTETRNVTISIRGPSVVNVTPAAGSTFRIGDMINISAAVTDGISSVDSVLARIALPNGTIVDLVMSTSGGGQYNASFGNLIQSGNYSITIIANNSLGHVNNSIITNFFRNISNSSQFFDVIAPNGQTINYTQAVLNNVSGLIDIQLNFTGMSINNIIVFRHNESSPFSLIRFSNTTGDLGRFDKAFSIDLSDTDMSNASVTLTAIGNTLYKCTNFTFSTSTCNEGYDFFMSIVSGQTYTFFLNSTDPGFGDQSPDAGTPDAGDFDQFGDGLSSTVNTFTAMQADDATYFAVRRANGGGAQLDLGAWMNVTYNITNLSVNQGVTPANIKNLSFYLNYCYNDDITGAFTCGGGVAGGAIPNPLKIQILNFTSGLFQNISTYNGSAASSAETNYTFNASSGFSDFVSSGNLIVIRYEVNVTITTNGNDAAFGADYAVLTVTYDNVKPSVTALVPAIGENFNSDGAIEIAANVTDAFGVSSVIANVSYPNGSSTLVILSNAAANKYNNTFVIPFLKGQYNVSIFANDTSNNVNNSERTNFFLNDSTPPRVVIIHPHGENFGLGTEVAIVVDARDLTGLDTIIANITLPNTTTVRAVNFSYGLQNDNFGSNSEGTNWGKKNITGAGQSCFVDINGVVPGKAFISVDGGIGPSTAQCGFNSIKKIDGNFDMNITFNITSFGDDTLFSFRSNSIDTFSAAGIRVFADIEKVSGAVTYVLGYNNGTGTTQQSVITNDSSGMLRIKRFNMTDGNTPVFNLYFMNNSNGQWTGLLGNISLPGSSRTQYVQLKPASTSSTFGELNITLDNFEVSGEGYLFTMFNRTDLGGRYNITILANDSLGYVNNSETTWFNITVINTPPSRPFLTEPDPGDSATGLFNLTWSQVIDNEGDALQFNITLLNTDGSFNSSIVSNYGNASSTYYQMNSSLYPDGLYSLQVRVFENATSEHYAVTETLAGNFTIGNNAPRVIVIYPRNATLNLNREVGITLDVNDVIPIDRIFANVTIPNGTVMTISDFGYPLRSDEFNNNSLGAVWEQRNDSVSSGHVCGQDINITNPGQLTLFINGTASSGTTSCGLAGIPRLNGDFDMNVTFNLTTYETSSAFVFRSKNTKTLASSGVRAFAVAFNDLGNYTYVLGYNNGTNSVSNVILNADRYGKFRIKRNNSLVTPTFYIYYWNNSAAGWVEVVSGANISSSSQTQFAQIYLESTGSGFGKITAAVDSFGVSRDNYLFDTFNQTSLEGQYNISYIFVNNSLGFVNNTETDRFHIVRVNTPPSFLQVSSPTAGSRIRRVFNITWFSAGDDEGDRLRWNITLLNPSYSLNATIADNFGSSSTTFYEWNTSLYADGNYNLNVTVYENETTEHYSNSHLSGVFVVDNSNPLVYNLRPAAGATYNLSQVIELGANVTDFSTLSNVSVNVTNPSGLVDMLFLENTGTGKYNASFAIQSNLPGRYNISYYANDSAGNINNTETSWFNVVDSVPPFVGYVTPSELNGSIVSRSNILVNVTANDNLALDSITIYLYNSSSALINQTTRNASSNFVNITNLNDGTYYFNATANDSFGNVNYTQTRTISLDTINPSVSFINPTESNGGLLNRTNIEITVSASNMFLANITIFLYNSTALVNSTTTTANTSFVNYTNLAEGVYRFNATAYDAAGNFNNTETRTVTIDTTNPNVTALVPSAGSLFNPSTTIEIAANVSDLNGINSVSANITRPNGNTTTITLTNATGSKYNSSFAITAEGIYNITIFAGDNAGNRNSSERTFFISNDTLAPVISLLNPGNGVAYSSTSQDVFFQYNVSDFNVANCSLNVNGSIVNFSSSVTTSGINEFVNNFGVGSYSWNVSCIDNKGNANTSETRTFSVAAPVAAPSTGGGGGGGYATPAVVKNETPLPPREAESIVANPSYLAISTVVGGQAEREITITNLGNSSIAIDFEVTGEVKDFLNLSDKSFIIDREGRRILKIIVHDVNRGSLTGKIILRFGNNVLEIPVVIDVRSGNFLFDVSLGIAEGFRVLSAGDKLVAQINLMQVGVKEKVDVTATYVIKDFSGKEFLRENESFFVLNTKDYIKEFSTANLPAGRYIVGLEIVYPGAFATSSAQFEITENGIFSPSNQIVVGAVAAAAAATGFVGWALWRVIRLRGLRRGIKFKGAKRAEKGSSRKV